MKYQILAGTLGIVLLLGMSPLPQAEAKIFIIDDFVLDPNGFCDISLLIVATSSCQQSGLSIAHVIGGVRDSSLTLDVANAPSNGVIDYVGETDDGAVGTTDEMFRHMAGSGVETTVIQQFDGEVGAGRSLGVNLLNSDDVRIQYSLSDFQVDVTVRVTDSGGDWAEQTGILVQGTVTLTELLFDIDNFVLAPSASAGVLNLEDIDEFKFTYDTVLAFTDYDLDLIDITMEMVGGEMFPINTTALLLAGVELNAIWILPAIAAIGIGAFIVSRKRN